MATNEHALAHLEELVHVSRKSWAKEYRTVRFGVARRMGHTTMAYRLARELAPKRSVVLHMNQNLVRVMAGMDEGGLVKSWTVNSPVGLRGLALDLVIIDTATFVSQAKIDAVVETCTTGVEDPLYVLLE